MRVEALAVFQWVLCGLGRFGVNLSCPGGFSGSTWRGFGVNLTCYEIIEIIVLGVFGVFRGLSRSLPTPPPGFRGRSTNLSSVCS